MRTHPAQVLDVQSELLDRFRTLAFREFAAEVQLRQMRALSKTPNRSSAEQVQRFGEVWADGAAAALRAAYAYHVTPEMVPLIQWAANDLPGVTQIQPEMFPTQTGFVWFDEPLPCRNRSDGTAAGSDRVRAMLWHHATSEFDGKRYAGVAIDIFTDIEDLNRVVSDHDPEDLTSEEVGLARALTLEEVALLRAKIGRTIPVGGQFFAYGTRIGPSTATHDPDVGPSPVDTLLRMLTAYWLMLGQTVADVREAEIPRAFGKRAVRAGIPARVTVVQLRRNDQAARRDGETLVEWSRRWVVRGHWRNQACGAGRTEHRLIWIAPFMKGPADRPLVVPEKVYSLKR
jgi:hypothetical protein